ncbi:putative inactive leucine-rich repeat receptor-like protein kinase [Raphanus sativus]|uniref:Probably inactive leucine-rich repeat receptor-like protein kinase At5g58150 n=1 Tax=Raphanus sativus TaxID=3726 RepID=A0A9W3CNC3_RAPSA|nr:probably inactive leucine-rich repeat receptor-like protein kinase At5g58150 [Raphanus sativus]KAJ4871911.1 putative inactive leucine-rich repeat receptor-like protein kinase [Raphanus sativus]
MGLSIWRALVFLSLFAKQLNSQDPNTDASHLSNFFNQMSTSSPKPHTFSSLCSSPGVVCDRQKQNILHFSAPGSNLSGPIPDNTIGKLIKLQSLDLSGNKITSLPSDLWSLDSLQHLNLSSNLISHPLPSNVGNFVSLRTLDLSFNAFSGDIPASISSLVALTTLNLNSNAFRSVLPQGLLNCRALVSIDLSSNRLTGSLPVGFGSAFPELKRLNLSRNLFQGSVNGVLRGNVETVDLSYNRFDGHVLHLIDGRNLSGLVYLDLSENGFVGHILNGLSSAQKLGHLNLASNRFRVQEFPQITKLSALYYLNLSKTNLVGLIPSEISQLSHLKVLDLSSNNLTGNVPLLLPLENVEVLDLSLNKLDGDIPRTVLEKLSLTQRFNFSFNNLTFCDPNFTQEMIQTSFVGLTNNCPFAAKPVDVQKGESVSKKKTGLKIGLTLAISMAFLLVALLVVLVALRGRRKSRTWAAKQAAEPNLLDQGESTDVPVVMIDKPLMKMTLADLKAATLNFDSGALLWESKSGPTYEAVLPGGFRAALKVVSSGTTLSDHEASLTFERLARINHPNLVPLSGYCIAAEQRIVIYEHLDYVNLHTLLHTTDDSVSWILRHKIALGTARALAFLHHGCIPPVVHGEVKAGTIFLDSSQEPQLAEFGLAKLLNEGLLVDLDGYTPTELEEQGSPTLESDVYSFGVVLLELVSGKKAEWDLVSWVRGLVREGQGSRAIDPTLQGTGPVEQIAEAVKIGYLCTADLSWKRPTMQQVVGLLKDISPS